MFACCDESGIHGDARWWVIGAMWLPKDAALPAYEARVTELRQETDCWGEFKWTSVDPRWLDAYRRFIALTLALPDLSFTSILVDTSLFTSETMKKYHVEGNRNEAYLKFVRLLLRNHLGRFASRHREFTVLYDRISMKQRLIRNFRGVLANDMRRLSRTFSGCRFKHLCSINSASRPLMQAADIFTGATWSVWEGKRDDSKKGEARKAIRGQLTAWAGCDLNATSNPRSRYDLWRWQPRPEKQDI